MKIGYARVSTEEQSLDLQIAALQAAECERIFSDGGISGTRFVRPGLESALGALESGDTLVVWRLDRLGRSLPKLVQLVDQLGEKQIHFSSLTECIDTTSSGGTLIFHIMAALAQFERALISERTRAGMMAARARGQSIGRRRAMTREQCDEALRLMTDRSTAQVARQFQVHPRTLLRNLRREGIVTQS
ncbi:DNA resolvase [Burkholderia sp. WAC0059]|uniref:recombinase family protein n=1 Tax=Burkholderia sp. WAC0059 TaxID=2066022 RepID=UPI000C7F39DE|nr:recombinase family protein [Burkholderia sp. WAC0059]PLZ00549.1 DNA resolvase [Burkholderia sp. WAC0059]